MDDVIGIYNLIGVCALGVCNVLKYNLSHGGVTAGLSLLYYTIIVNRCRYMYTYTTGYWLPQSIYDATSSL